MDLYAYCQIKNLDKIAAANGIDIPRLRGYRYMRDEEKVSQEEINEQIKDEQVDECKDILRRVAPDIYEYSDRTDRRVKKYIIFKTVSNPDGFDYEKAVGIRWPIVHGKLRKEMKFAMKKARKKVIAQLEMFNKYVGREDVLYIHSRIGGNNWNYYDGPELEKQPWFLEKIDDYYDDTYCDIYAKIDPATVI